MRHAFKQSDNGLSGSDLNVDFTFDLNFGPFDLLILGIYLIFLYPCLLLVESMQRMDRRVQSVSSSRRLPPALKHPLQTSLAMISKIF